MVESIIIPIDKAKFIEIGRVFVRVGRPRDDSAMRFHLSPGKLLIEFRGGGCVFPVTDSSVQVSFDAMMKAREFTGIMAAHKNDKVRDGMMLLTFRPSLGEIATPLAGGKAAFLLSSSSRI